MGTRKQKKHKFEKLPDFDRAMRKLVSVPKETPKAEEKPAKKKSRGTSQVKDYEST